MPDWLRRAAVGLVLAAGAVLGNGARAAGEAYPNRPVRILVPYGPGGAGDLTVRLVANKLSQNLKHPFIIENRPGAGGIVAMRAVLGSAADGYTLGEMGNGQAISMSLFKNLPYQLAKDLAPVTLLATFPSVIAVHPALPVKNVKELVALGRARPNELFFGSSGPGATDHLAGELFNMLTGTKMVHVPYKGGAPAMLDLMSGNVQIIFATVSTSIGQIKGGKIRALGMTGTPSWVIGDRVLSGALPLDQLQAAVAAARRG